eukprot:CAMPEP_0118924760 /NCGR_PEP_ID=MMETSP1169-20130426/2744_1 /TAXON_ID=36882 /ORGANISM="Pyramimonas obovata, Strain CCMP722" /LENGTH=326 /DNA_ID=CAMNT_0006865891 /DNA_START=87 /DNA_END=1064 /DNA_ORIENTATION=+
MQGHRSVSGCANRSTLFLRNVSKARHVPPPYASREVQLRVSSRAGVVCRVAGKADPIVTGDAPPTVAVPTSKADAISTLGYSFSPAALLLPYHIGVAEELTLQGLITESTPLAGSSAGFIVVVCIASGVPFNQVVARIKDLMQDLRENGYVGRVQAVMRRVLVDMLPDDIHVRLNSRACCSCGITRLKFGDNLNPLEALEIAEFFSKSDVIAAIEASGWVPIWIAPGMFVRFRGEPCVDGFPTQFFPTPMGKCETVVRVTPTHAAALGGLEAAGLVKADEVDICPGGPGYSSRFSALKLSSCALAPYDDKTVDDLVAMGREDAAVW